MNLAHVIPSSSEHIAVFDTETTGTDARESRLVSAFFGVLDPAGALVYEREWLVYPDGFEVSSHSTRIHGITDAHARENGRALRKVLVEIGECIDRCRDNGTPLAGQNVQYDLNIVDAEMRRVGMLPLITDDLAILDSLILDRRLVPKRTGSRKLVDLVHYYHLHLGDAFHEARFDAIAAGLIVRKQLKNDLLQSMPADVLNEAQAIWFAEQQRDLQNWLRQTDPTATVPMNWPIDTKEAV